MAIASILAMRPNTIIVDEPTTGQDMRQSIEVMNFLSMLCEKEGHTITIITHEMQIVADYTRRTVVLGQGSVLLDAPTREVFAEPGTLKKTFVAPPQITRLGQALTDFGIPPSVLSIDEMKEEFKKVKEH